MENQVGSAAPHPARTPALRNCSIGSEENSLDQEFLVLVMNFNLPDLCWEWPLAGASRSGKFLKSEVPEHLLSHVLREPPGKMPS